MGFVGTHLKLFSQELRKTSIRKISLKYIIIQLFLHFSGAATESYKYFHQYIPSAIGLIQTLYVFQRDMCFVCIFMAGSKHYACSNGMCVLFAFLSIHAPTRNFSQSCSYKDKIYHAEYRCFKEQMTLTNCWCIRFCLLCRDTLI